MSAPVEARRRPILGILPVWIAALGAGIVILFTVPTALQPGWFAITLAGSLILAFAIQLAGGRSKGFIERIATSVAGALVALGLVTLAALIMSSAAGS